MEKKTLVIGASLKPQRYSNKAINKLIDNDIETLAIGLREGEVSGVEIIKYKAHFNNIHTVTLYLNANNQKSYYDYIISLNPQRVIFNPGTENYELYQLLQDNGIHYEIACTLVLLSTNQY